MKLITTINIEMFADIKICLRIIILEEKRAFLVG